MASVPHRSPPATSPRLSTYLGLERLVEEADGNPSPDLLERLDIAWKALTAYEVAWLRSRRPGEDENPFQSAARSRKVLALVAIVPTGETSEQNRLIAEFLAGLSVPDRAVFAMGAKVNAPSAETWQRVVDAVRARRPISEIG